MARLAISRDFLPEYARLDRSVQAKVDDVFARFAEHTHAGAHLEKMKGAVDPRVRTVRIDDHYRGIVMAPDADDTYLLLHVLTHDQSDKWVARHRFGVNAATGALEVLDAVAISEAGTALDHHEPQPAEAPLFADRQAKDFTRLGVAEALVPVLRRIRTAAELDGLAAVLPAGQGDALHMLAAGYSVEEAWSELVGGEDPGSIDQFDVDGALARPASQAMFYVVQGSDALLDVLSRPFDLWRTFLHPSQKRLAYQARYGGPARITGGAGTGKTVVAMHRAKFLAELDDGPILFTTFTRNLAAAIARDLGTLGGEWLGSRVDVRNIDRVAYAVVRGAESRDPKLADDDEQISVWQDVVAELETQFPPSFLRREWLHVILAQGIRSRDEYFAAPRQGRGVRLDRRQRAEVWTAVNQFTSRLAELGERTHYQLAADAADILAARPTPPYAHVIVDEAQDLHPAQWRMLRAAVPEAPNDLFIVGDAHQRIYDHRTSLSSVGINVRGRSRRLRINYRTTHEILRWSLGLLASEEFDDMDNGTDTLAGYHSQLHGPEPALIGYTNRKAELDGLVQAIRSWQGRGAVWGDIGITARTRDVVGVAARALSDAGIPSHILAAEVAEPAHMEKVWLATMHGMKGLEFRCLAVLDVGQDRIPLPVAVTPVDEDPMEHDHDLQRERSLLFVAATRARDELRLSWTGRPSPFLAIARGTKA